MLKIWKNFFRGCDPKLVIAFFLFALLHIAGAASLGVAGVIFMVIVWVFLVPYTIYQINHPKQEGQRPPHSSA